MMSVQNIWWNTTTTHSGEQNQSQKKTPNNNNNFGIVVMSHQSNMRCMLLTHWWFIFIFWEFHQIRFINKVCTDYTHMSTRHWNSLKFIGTIPIELVDKRKENEKEYKITLLRITLFQFVMLTCTMWHVQRVRTPATNPIVLLIEVHSWCSFDSYYAEVDKIKWKQKPNQLSIEY